MPKYKAELYAGHTDTAAILRIQAETPVPSYRLQIDVQNAIARALGPDWQLDGLRPLEPGHLADFAEGKPAQQFHITLIRK